MEAYGAQWLHRLGRTLLAPRCLVCGARGVEGLDLCADCVAALPWNTTACPRCALPMPHAQTCGHCLQHPPPMTTTRAALVYGTPLDQLVPRLKFHGDLAAGRLLAALMARGLADAERPQALVPVPLHNHRLRRRGYDQALELARPLGQALGIPVLDGVLLRTRDTAPQSERDARARRRNLRGAFAVRPTLTLPDHVALIDDVMTTGATLQASARALLQAGIGRVDAWICARAP